MKKYAFDKAHDMTKFDDMIWRDLLIYISWYTTLGAELEDAVKSAAAAVKNSFITEKVRLYSLRECHI